MIGAFGLVLFGCGAAAIAGGTNLAGTAGLGLLGISIAFGLSVVLFAYAIGGVSGCHINPAVTIGLLVAGKISMKDTVLYMIAQILGAILGAFVLAQILYLGSWQVLPLVNGRMDPTDEAKDTKMNMV